MSKKEQENNESGQNVDEINVESTENQQEINENKQEINEEEKGKEEEIIEEQEEKETLDIDDLSKKEDKKKEITITKVDDSLGDFSGMDLGGFDTPSDTNKGGDSKTAKSTPPVTTSKKKVTRKKEQKKEITPAMSERGARLSITLVDTINCRVCAWIGGKDKDRYRLTKSEKKELTELLSEYLTTMQIEASPQTMLLMGFGIIMFSKYVTVVEDFGEKKKEQKAKKVSQQKEKEEPNKEEKVKEIEPAKEEPKEEPKNKEAEKLSFSNFAELEEYIYNKMLESSFVEKTNSRGKFSFYTKGKYRGFYEWSESGKRYAVDKKKEHLQDSNNKPSIIIFQSWNLIKEFIGDEHDAHKKLGKIIRRVKKDSHE